MSQNADLVGVFDLIKQSNGNTRLKVYECAVGERVKKKFVHQM